MRLTLTIRPSTPAGVRGRREHGRPSSSSAGTRWATILAAGGIATACASSANGSVTGSAWACAGAAITAGGTVTVEAYSDLELVASVTTNASHEYTMQLPPGIYTIRVPANDPEGVVASDQVMVTASQSVEANFANSCR
jgi:hypothetical protein